MYNIPNIKLTRFARNNQYGAGIIKFNNLSFSTLELLKERLPEDVYLLNWHKHLRRDLKYIRTINPWYKWDIIVNGTSAVQSRTFQKMKGTNYNDIFSNIMIGREISMEKIEQNNFYQDNFSDFLLKNNKNGFKQFYLKFAKEKEKYKYYSLSLTIEGKNEYEIENSSIICRIIAFIVVYWFFDGLDF